MKRPILLATAFSLTAFLACDQLGDPSSPVADQQHEFEVEMDETAEAIAKEKAALTKKRARLAKRVVRMNKRFNGSQEYGIQAKLSVGAGEDYTTIQDAVDAASPGDKIKVKDSLSPYVEDVVVDVPDVRLTAEGDVTVIGSITVIADEVTVDHFRVEAEREDGVYGIHLDGVTDCELEDNYVVGGSDGIRLDDSSDCLLKGNTTTGADTDGIELNESHNNVVDENTSFGNDDDGIEVDDSDNNEIKGNDFSNNGAANTPDSGTGDGIDLSGEGGSSGNEMEDNVCNNNPDTGIEIGGSGSNNNTVGSDNEANNCQDNGLELNTSSFDNFVKKNEFKNNSPCDIEDRGTDNEFLKNDIDCFVQP